MYVINERTIEIFYFMHTFALHHLNKKIYIKKKGEMEIKKTRNKTTIGFNRRRKNIILIKMPTIKKTNNDEH